MKVKVNHMELSLIAGATGEARDCRSSVTINDMASNCKAKWKKNEK
jgi:hypothetical protein